MTVAILRVVGPPGSGKTLLIVSLAEALRSRGHRVATVVRRLLPGREAATVIVLSNSGRVTNEQLLTLERLRALMPSIDPSVDIILAEGYDDAAFPAIACVPRGGDHSGDAIAFVVTEEIAATFARLGPGDMGDTNSLIDLVEHRVLGLPPREVAPPSRTGGWRGVLRRLRGR